MDDCDLEKLIVKPGKLSPNFSKNVLNYNVTLAADVEKFSLELLTRDSGASYTIKRGDGSKTIPIKEGELFDLPIEVTAEDGKTTKIYKINIKRMSLKDATLTGLTVSHESLQPSFNSGILKYQCYLPATIGSLKVTPTVADTKCEMRVNGEKPGGESALCLSDTHIDIGVTSADGSTKKSYLVQVIRAQIPRHIVVKDPALAIELEDPVTLSVFYRPVSIKGTGDPGHVFSRELLSHLTRVNKVDPLDQLPLPVGEDWEVEAVDVEKKLSKAEGFVVLTRGGYSPLGPVSTLGTSLKDFNKPPVIEENKGFSPCKVAHSLVVRKWETKLQKIYDETDAVKLAAAAEQATNKYFDIVPPKSDYRVNFGKDESPVDYLKKAIHNIATALQAKPKDANLHLKLGLLLEEKYWIVDQLGIKEKEETADFGLSSVNQAAFESGREDEIQAICKLQGHKPPVPLALQLKALDIEYHNLLDQKQSARADAVMNLFLFKSKQSSQEGVSGQKAESEDSPLGQAYIKYLDALVCDENKAAHHFHVGRLLLTQGNYPDAVKRLEAALSINSKLESARFCLGLALGCQKDGPSPARLDEAVRYLLDGLELLLMTLSTEAEQTAEPDLKVKRSSLLAENFFTLNNTLLLRGAVTLGDLLSKGCGLKDVMSGKDAYHTGALLCGILLPQLSKGATYTQVEWLLINCHAVLLDQASADKSAPPDLVYNRCQRLSAIIQNSTIPMNDRLLALHEKSCEQLVWAQPCNSVALYKLGQAKVTRAENSSSGEQKAYLEASIAAFISAVDFEGKPDTGPPATAIKEQSWWQERVKAETPNLTPAAGTPKTVGSPAAAGARPVVATSAGRGAATPAARGGRAAPPGRAPVKGASAKPGEGSAKPAPARAPIKPGAAGAKAPVKPVTTPGKAPVANKGPLKPEVRSAAKEPVSSPETPPVDTAPPVEQKKPSSRPAVINRKSYLPRIGLARVYRLLGNTDESHKFFNEVIAMEPNLHDAYIESAEMLTSAGEALKAVDIYTKFPVDENNLTFDDAYIFGEIVAILMKNEKFDDPRLPQFMIKWGRVLGLGVLEKSIEILDNKLKTAVCKQVYAGVHGKSVDDPALQGFFKIKCWI